jgi:alpha-N-arabinofuranosidase
MFPLAFLLYRTTLASALFLAVSVQADEPPILTLTSSGSSLATRPNLYGQNIASIDWHGSGEKRNPILWDEAAVRPNPAWDALTHVYPLHVIRYNVGNEYPWRDAVGPVAARKPIVGDESWKPIFATGAGLQEFLAWLETLPQKPEAMLIASPFRPTQEIADLVAYCNATSGPMAALRASHGHPAPYGVKYWEMGNETDWRGRTDLDVTRPDTEQEKSKKLLVSEYIQRCQERIAAMRAVDPSIQIFAHAQTSPWPNSNPQWRSWHREIIKKLGAQIDGISIHPYYDGYPVPYILASLDALIADIKELQPKGKNLVVIISEHARWIDPAKHDNWSQSWGLQGAISTGDFLLHCMARPQIAMANYWCYLHRGPWRVLNADWDQGGTSKFGTGIHALFILLNAAVLPRFELLPVDQGTQPTLLGYKDAVTAGLFTDPTTGDHALVVVNRSEKQAWTLRLPNLTASRDEKVRQSLITAGSLNATNVPEKPAAVKLITSLIPVSRDASGALLFQLPPRCVVSWQWK